MAERIQGEDVSRGESLSQRLEASDGAGPDQKPPKSNGLRFVPLLGVAVATAGFVVWLATATLNIQAIIGGIAGFGASIWGMVAKFRGIVFGMLAKRQISGSESEGLEGATATIVQSGGGLPGLNFAAFFLAITLAPGFFIGAVLYSQGLQALGIAVGVVIAVVSAVEAIAWEASRRKTKLSPGVGIGRPELDKWIERNTLRTDELVRAQIGRDLAGAFDDISAARIELSGGSIGMG